MFILEGLCPHCYGNLVMSEEGYTLTCEECGATDTATKKEELATVLVKYGVMPNRSDGLKSIWTMLQVKAKEYGSMEKRRGLTLAGKGLLKSFRACEIPADAQCEEIDQALEASRGLITDEKTLKHLEEEGFIRPE